MKKLPQDMTREEQDVLGRVLAQAIRLWDRESIQRCLEAGAEPTGLLSAAIAKKDVDIVRQAMMRGADPEVMIRVNDRVYQPALHLAHDHYVPEIVDFLVKSGVPIDQKNSLGETVLDRAVTAGDFEKMRFYQERGADAACDANAVLLAAITKKRPDMIQWAVERGADVRMTIRANGSAITVLHHALVNFDRDIFSQILKCGISVDARDSAGNTVLHLAAGNADSKKVEFLLQKGADPLLRNYAGVSPLENAQAGLDKATSLIQTQFYLHSHNNNAGVSEQLSLKEKFGVDPTNVLTRRDITLTGPLELKKPPANDAPPSV